MDHLKTQIVQRLHGRTAGSLPIGNGHLVDVIEVPVDLWTGPRIDSNRLDCNKKAGLLTGTDGSMSCLEVEVVKSLRQHGEWLAGWVQAWSCGAGTWSTWIWRTLPSPVAARNERVQIGLGRSSNKLAGHPDVSLVVGDRVLYLECKISRDTIDKQVAWIAEAIRGGAIDGDDVRVVQGVPRG